MTSDTEDEPVPSDRPPITAEQIPGHVKSFFSALDRAPRAVDYLPPHRKTDWESAWEREWQLAHDEMAKGLSEVLDMPPIPQEEA